MRVISIFIMVSYVFGDSDISEYNVDYSHSDEKFPNFDDELRHLDPEFPHFDTDYAQHGDQRIRFITYFEETCRNFGGKEAAIKWLEAFIDLVTCMDSVVNVTQLDVELHTFITQGILDLDYKKYCRASPEMQTCFSNFSSSTLVCYEQSDRDMYEVINKVAYHVFDYMCSENGYMIQVFIEEEGPQCLFAHKNIIMECIHSQYLYLMNVNNNNMDGAAQSWNITLCESLKSIQNCVHNVLQLCSSRMPSLIVENVLNYLWKLISCRKIPISDTNSVVKKVHPYLTDAMSNMVELVAGTISSDGCETEHGLKNSVQKQDVSLEVLLCLASRVNFSYIGEDADDYFYARIFCRMIAVSQECKLKLMNHCGTELKKEGRRTYYNITMSLFDVMCSKEEDRLGELITNNGLQCSLDKLQDISEKCDLQSLDNVLPDYMISNMNQVFIYGEDKCRKVRKNQECIVEILNQCPEQTPGRFVNDIINELLNLMDCNKRVGLGSSKGFHITSHGIFLIYSLFIINNIII